MYLIDHFNPHQLHQSTEPIRFSFFIQSIQSHPSLDTIKHEQLLVHTIFVFLSFSKFTTVNTAPSATTLNTTTATTYLNVHTPV
jgi:hypothetical protein